LQDAGLGDSLARLNPNTSGSGKKTLFIMCLAIPARIVEIADNMGTIDMEGTRRQVSLLLLEGAGVGDYVIVHAGFAIHKIDEGEAMESIKLLREMASLVDNKNL
jgi:hydrogenase expression/formation protein HypC